MRHIITILMVLVISLSACGKPIVDRTGLHDQITRTHRPVISYSLARQLLFGKLHYNNGIVTDVYCNENHDSKHGVGPGLIPDPKFLNCEHTWPQSKFVGSEAETMKVDLHHLYPANSKANTSRSNNPFGEIDSHPNVCNVSIRGTVRGTNLVGFEPPDRHKGNVARAIFYFSVRYQMPVDLEQEEYLRKWNHLDPVDIPETIRNNQIQEIQGNRNPFIDDPNLIDSISDF